MKKLTRTFTTLGVATLTIALGVSPATVATASTLSAAGGNGGTFSVGELDPPSFIPGQNEGAALDELNALFAPLTKFNAQGKLEYVQAQSVTASAGATVWTIRSSRAGLSRTVSRSLRRATSTPGTPRPTGPMRGPTTATWPTSPVTRPSTPSRASPPPRCCRA